MARERIYRDKADKQRAYRQRQRWKDMEAGSVDSYTSALRLWGVLKFASQNGSTVAQSLAHGDVEETLAKFVAWMQAHPAAVLAMLQDTPDASGPAANAHSSEQIGANSQKRA